MRAGPLQQQDPHEARSQGRHEEGLPFYEAINGLEWLKASKVRIELLMHAATAEQQLAVQEVLLPAAQAASNPFKGPWTEPGAHPVGLEAQFFPLRNAPAA